MNINPTSLKIVIDQQELEEAFPDYSFPFSLKKMIKEVNKNDGIKYLSDEIIATIKHDPEMKTSPLLTSKGLRYCGIYKMRIKKKNNNRGKSSGYRVIFLLITALETGYVLDITDHNIRDDLTDEQKRFCNKLAQDLENEIKKII